ncbi:MAG: methionyl-tRNA formyltransferase [Lachnospiraceae bacterium]|nr:methionyl-tRNA formyltransferase [Lachnospiraceae bacterium]MCM1237847.1 methionyl-tRNA formyltransferase [Lachnospiraceae bacterium]
MHRLSTITIGYFADGPWSHYAFEKMIQDETIHIAFICVRYDKKDSVLQEFGRKYNIDVLFSPNVNAPDFINVLKRYNVDLFVSMSFNQIFKAEIINLPKWKTINCHAGKLPFYRGRNILNWVLINDEKDFGITVHYVDEGIDTGDIILQRNYSITDDDDYGTLLKRAYIGCADVLYEAVKLIQIGKANAIKQETIDPVGIYCGMRKSGDEIINWNSTSRELFNFVRAICKPGPMATSMLNGKMIKINKVREVKGAHRYINTPGQILGKTKDGFYVKTKDTVIEVIEYIYEGIIRVGDRLGNE